MGLTGLALDVKCDSPSISSILASSECLQLRLGQRWFQGPGLEAGVLHDFWGAESGLVDYPAAEEVRRVLGYVALREQADAASKGHAFLHRQFAVTAVVTPYFRQADEEIRRSDRIGAGEDAGRDMVGELDELASIANGVPEGEPLQRSQSGFFRRRRGRADQAAGFHWEADRVA